MPAQQDLGVQLRNAFDANVNTCNRVSLNDLSKVFTSIKGLNCDSSLVQQWNDYYRRKGVNYLSFADLQFCCNISSINLREIGSAPFSDEKIWGQRTGFTVDVIEAPPLVDNALLQEVNVLNSGGFGSHKQSFQNLMAKIEQLEVVEEQRLQAILDKFGGLKGGAFGVPDVLRKMVAYCTELKRENQFLTGDIAQNCQQNHRLIDIIQQFQAFELWWRNQEDRVRELHEIIEDLRARVAGLKMENSDLGRRLDLYLTEINELKIRLEEIEYLKIIIERQAWELGQRGGEVEYYFSQLSTIQSHYASHVQRIREVSQELTAQISQVMDRMNMSKFDVPVFQVVPHSIRNDLKLAIQSLIYAGASRDSLGQKYYKNRNEAKAVAKLICQLKNDINDGNRNSQHWNNFVSAGNWEQECAEHFSPDGRLVGSVNIEAFFRHVIAYRTGL